jgi:hypothetical protein
MKNYYGDILIAVLFIVGVAAFFNGEFTLSAVLFAATVLASNVFRKGLDSINRIKKPDA